MHTQEHPSDRSEQGMEVPDAVVVEEVRVKQGLHQAGEVHQHVVAVTGLVVRPPHPVQDVQRPIGSQEEYVVPCGPERSGRKEKSGNVFSRSTLDNRLFEEHRARLYAKGSPRVTREKSTCCTGRLPCPAGRFLLLQLEGVSRESPERRKGFGRLETFLPPGQQRKKKYF